jgi:hypothetical protein
LDLISNLSPLPLPLLLLLLLLLRSFQVHCEMIALLHGACDTASDCCCRGADIRATAAEAAVP